jgi:hypothetical protein
MVDVPDNKNIVVCDIDGLSPAVCRIVQQINDIRAIQSTVKNYLDKVRL